MNKSVTIAAVLAISSLPIAAHAQGSGAVPGAVGGAAAGAVVGGPVGAVVGGVAGAALGGALSADESTKVKQYVVREHRPSVRVTEKVTVGEPLPPNVELYTVPADTGVRTDYRYTVVNDHTVLVDPRSRKIVQVIE
ncbi:DUF1236 domain-containing protein [Microvirga massiliensis]|uniref:DUF1236 domain-containing protein n=1 Tax=Microvirga massiliensis TaxID=1033741 RepID=UPI00062BC556|nr:DUF1236 domain-containing protein [Microvirga massiliensis]